MLAKKTRLAAIGASLLAAGLTGSPALLAVAHAATASPPPAGGYFSTLPVKAALVSGDSCASQVHRDGWEPRPDNRTANQNAPSSVALPANPSFNAAFNSQLLPRVDGNFTGTTDEIIQWASCKWGFSDDLTRAQMVNESTWHQSAVGDMTSDISLCPADQRSVSPCPQSFGVLQVKARYHPGAYPLIAASTAFQLDYSLALRRGCYEGMQYGAGFQSGDLWGCVGSWYSGAWYDTGAKDYIARVQGFLNDKPWRTWPDQSGTTPSASPSTIAAPAPLGQPTPTLTPTPTPTPVPGSTPAPTSSPSPTSSRGLSATYYNNSDFTGFSVKRVDSNIDRDWGTGAPVPTIWHTTFSARWTGSLTVPASGSYRLTTVSDDGVRVWLGGKQVISNWTPHGATRNTSGRIYLRAGTPTPIRIDYYQNEGLAQMRLLWSGSGNSTAVAVPMSALSQS